MPTTPTHHAEQIAALLEKTDTATAKVALRIAEALLDYRVTNEISVALEAVRKEFQIPESQPPVKTSLDVAVSGRCS